MKRVNWIAQCMYVLFGWTPPPNGPLITRFGPQVSVYLAAGVLFDLLEEGVANGFIPAPTGWPGPVGSSANVVIDSDFTTYWPSCNASTFLAMVAGMQAVNATWTANFQAIAAAKP